MTLKSTSKTGRPSRRKGPREPVPSKARSPLVRELFQEMCDRRITQRDMAERVRGPSLPSIGPGSNPRKASATLPWAPRRCT